MPSIITFHQRLIVDGMLNRAIGEGNDFLQNITPFRHRFSYDHEWE